MDQRIQTILKNKNIRYLVDDITTASPPLSQPRLGPDDHYSASFKSFDGYNNPSAIITRRSASNTAATTSRRIQFQQQQPRRYDSTDNEHSADRTIVMSNGYLYHKPQPPPPLLIAQQQPVRRLRLQPPVFDIESLVSIVIFLPWTVILLGYMIDKLVKSDGDLAVYFSYFTNWSWTANALFFFLDFLSYFEFRPKKVVRHYSVLLFVWFVNGTSWLVNVIVCFVLFNNPDLLVKISNESGLSPGTVLCGDRLVHVVPPFVMALYLVVRRKYIFAVIYHYARNYRALVAYATISLFSPIIVILVYWIAFDVHELYGITSPLIVIIGVGVLTIIITNILPFTMFYFAVFQPVSNLVIAKNQAALFHSYYQPPHAYNSATTITSVSSPPPYHNDY